MKVISVVNFKGGVGKTTITANLAYGLHARGKRVLAIDIDPQSSLTFSFIPVETWISEYQARHNLKSWIDSILYQERPGSLQSVIRESKKIHFIFSHLGLAEAEMSLSMGLASSSPLQYQYNYLKVHSYLRQALAEPSISSNYDAVLIDCPPNFGLLTRNAFFASDYYLIPTKMDELSTYGIDSFQTLIQRQTQIYQAANQKFKRDFSPPEFLGVVATMVSFVKDEQPIGVQAAQMMELEQKGIRVFNSKVRVSNDMYGKAAKERHPVIGYKSSNPAHKKAIEELKRLTLEVADKAAL
jgi:ATPases involved in chromosome partitioning